MTSNKIFRILALVCAVALLTVGTAGASTITYTSTFGPQPTDFLTSLNLQQWNPALFPGQVLQGVALSFTFSDNVNLVTLTNVASSTPETFKITLTSDVYTGPQTTPTLTPHVLNGPPDILSPNDISVPLFASGVISLGPSGDPACAFATPIGTGVGACSSVQYDPGVVNGGSSVNANPANFGYYTGSSTFALDVATQASSAFTGGGNNINLTISDNATVTATVVYTYGLSGTPEPATMAMLGSALIALGIIGRKKLSR